MDSRFRTAAFATAIATGITTSVVWTNKICAEPIANAARADPVKKEPKFMIKPEARKFLQEHIKDGKTVDGLIGAYNNQSKKMCKELLGIIETTPKTNGNPQAASQLAEIMDNFNKRQVAEFAGVLREYMKDSFYDYALMAGFSGAIDGRLSPNPAVSELTAALASGSVIPEEELSDAKAQMKRGSEEGLWPREQ